MKHVATIGADLRGLHPALQQRPDIRRLQLPIYDTQDPHHFIVTGVDRDFNVFVYGDKYRCDCGEARGDAKCIHSIAVACFREQIA